MCGYHRNYSMGLRCSLVERSNLVMQRESGGGVDMSSVWQAKIFLDAPFIFNVFSPLPTLATSIQQQEQV